MIQTSLILLISSILVFTIYNIVAIKLFRVPTSLSDTFYLYQNKKKGLGYIFTAMMWTMAFLLMPAWLTISDSMPGWEHNFTFLAFFAAAAIVFVGSAPAFRNVGLENKVHMIAAKSCAVFAIAWCAVVCWRIMYVIPIMIGLVWAFAALLEYIHLKMDYSNHTPEEQEKFDIKGDLKYVLKRHSDYWWEMCAFGATFATVGIQELILLLQ